MLLLSAEKIEKSYGIKPLLKGVSLYLEQGDKIGVVGSNGMGKSTLLKLIACDDLALGDGGNEHELH